MPRLSRFSPLLIGDRFEASHIRARDDPFMRRFSPLLIGDRFEAVSDWWQRSTCIRVSVPSSSGIGLKLDLRSVSPRRQNGFSPLLIGDRFEAQSRYATERAALSFSPLLIGDRFEARLRDLRDRALIGFSPLLIGDRFEASSEHGAASYRAVSVPSSSGIGLKRCCANRHSTQLSMFQSPPHRGSV